ncbi:ABC transporter permease [bacterium]|nr:ABC transporter permease [bacterium]
MWINYLKLAMRSLLRGRLYSVINVTGFAVGIAAAMLLVLYIRFELSYDTFHTKSDRLYALEELQDWGGGNWQEIPWSSLPMGPSIVADFPAVVNQTRIMPIGYYTLQANETKLVGYFNYGEASFFEMFDIPLLHGKAGQALSEPNTIALSRDAAGKFFGDENPVGKSMTFSDDTEVRVDAVYENIPENSQFYFDYIISFETVLSKYPEYAADWFPHNNQTFLEFSDAGEVTSFEAGLNAYLLDKAGAEKRQQFEAFLRPLEDMHLKGDYSGIRMFALIALFTLLVACINYMNLATARSLKRSREIGVRKVLGSSRRDLIGQFLGESMLVSLIAVALALLMLELALPWFEVMVGIPFREALHLTPTELTATVLSVGLVVGLLSGSYPALFLSSFKPVRVLKAGISSRNSGAYVRRGLVVVQFAVTIALILSTITVLRQHNHLLTMDPGFDRDKILYVPLQGEAVTGKAFEIRDAFLKVPGVEAASLHGRVLGRQNGGIWNIHTPAMGEDEQVPIFALHVDEDYLPTMGLNLAWGRNFSHDFSTDQDQAFLVNEAALEKLGIDVLEDPRVDVSGQEGEIVGVVRNFHFQPLRHAIEPVVFILGRDDVGWHHRYVALKLSSDSMSSTLAALETVWKSFDPWLAFEYHFLNEWMELDYRREQKLANLLGLFSGLAIVVAALGLFGLAAWSTQQRTREIGIRKVLGADAGRIVLLLTADFVRPVLLANLIAWPVAWLFMHRWLSGFAYRVPVNWGLNLLAALIVLAIAWLVMAATTLRAALSKPAKALRYE